MALRALARVNVAAIERNVARLRERLTGGAALCAVVKADGYGHGAAFAARGAIAGGARSLAVATAVEAGELRDRGVGAPVLVMGAISDEELPAALAAQAEVVAWEERFVERLVTAHVDYGRAPVRVHVKLDTGMGRLGTRCLGEALRVAEAIASTPRLELAGAMTHFATADGDTEFVAVQLDRFEPFVAELRRHHPAVIAHAANSAATLTNAATHLDLVRCGIAIYGCDPMNADPEAHGLEPVLELTSYVAAIKRAEPGDSAGYGRRFIAERETLIATVPIGYADGIRRALGGNCDVIVRGTRHPVVGAVSMDNITLDLGPQTDVQVGDAATIIGRNGDQRQTVEDLAAGAGTINYEILTGLGARVPRVHHRDGEAL